MLRYLFLILVLSVSGGGAIAELGRVPSKEELVHRLSSEGDTSDNSAPVARGFRRGVTIEGDRTYSSKENQAKSIDLEVNFDYNKSTLTADARIVLDRLGEALNDPKLQGANFLIAGHTDAKGSESYNQKLSQGRAKAVAEYLQRSHHVSGNRLRIEGYGSSRLLDAGNPESSINRRVQVTNLD